LNEGISHRTGSKEHTTEPLIDIKPYTFVASVEVQNSGEEASLLLSAEKSVAIDNGSPALRIKSQNSMSRIETEQHYDVIVYATGYERSSWVELLKNSSIGKHFGLTSSSSNIRLVPSSEGLQYPPPTISLQVQYHASSTSSSAESSPHTSPELGMFSSGELERPQHQHQELAISRNYRLLPLGFSSERKEQTNFTPRIYLQGVEEYTHGLSDTLLSVLGVRAGEVVNDLLH